jgi:hypothetical protein
VNAAAETSTWAHEAGLDVSKRPDRWQLDGKLTARRGKKVVAILNISIWAGAWDVTLFHGRERGFYGRFLTEQPERDGALPVPAPRNLADVRAWIVRVERKLGVAFQRDAVEVTSTIKGGKPAMIAWLEKVS